MTDYDFNTIVPYYRRYETRNKQILQDRRSGMTLAAVGAKYGIGKERVRQICLKLERKEKWDWMPLPKPPEEVSGDG